MDTDVDVCSECSFLVVCTVRTTICVYNVIRRVIVVSIRVHEVLRRVIVVLNVVFDDIVIVGTLSRENNEELDRTRPS